MHKRRNAPSKISFLYGIGFVLILGGLLVCVHFIETSLPKLLTLEDEVDDSPRFIGESAKNYLKGLVDIGPRVVGSYENEVLAVKYLTNVLIGIILHKHTNQEIEIDLDSVGGSYYLGYKPYGSINAYANLQNIVVKLHSKNKSDKSILINAHFDTMTTSGGGSDDGINCAIMLEILRVISKTPVAPLHNIIFLFNGGEESNIQASHGFISQHKWAKEAKVVINLEATGAGGKEILFQAGPERAWLIQHYSKVPYPFANVAGEEIFKSNIIPSDSDFRIFRDFGGLVGYDFAYIKDGYRYHTKYDGIDNIEDGIYQRSGENILSLTLSLSEAKEITEENLDEDGAVFFDVFGLFIVHYGRTGELTVNIMVIVLSLLTVAWCFIDLKVGYSAKSYLLIALKFVVILAEWIVSAILVLLVGLLLDGFGRTMSWYKTPYIAIGLYSMLTLLGSCSMLVITNRFLKRGSLTIPQEIILHSHLTRLIWTLIVLIGTCYGIKSVYLFTIPVAFNIVTTWIIHGLKIHQLTNLWVVVYIIGNLFPTMFIYAIGYHVLGLFIPICGRFGSETNPEFLVGLITMFLTIMSLCYYVPLILLLKGRINIILFFLSLFVASFILVLTPVGFPYSGNLRNLAPQRFSIYHTQRTFKNEAGEIIKSDAGFHFLPMDYNSPKTVKSYVQEMEHISSLEEDCENYLFCGLPVTYSRDFEELSKTIWIPTHPPVFKDVLPQLSHTTTKLSDRVIRYTFNITGPDCMDVYLSPKEGITFLKTNLNDFIPDEQPLWNGRPTLYILYVYGMQSAPLEFYVDFETPENWNGVVLDVAITGKYLHEGLNYETSHYTKFLKQFPDFAVINTRALGYYESRII